MASTIKLVAGILIIIIGFPIFIGGSAILLVTPVFADNQGYFTSNNFRIEQDGVAAIRWDIPLDEVQLGIRIDPSDFVRFKINVRQQGVSPMLTKEAFFGLATNSEATTLLNSVSYLRIVDFDLGSGFTFDSEKPTYDINGIVEPNKAPLANLTSTDINSVNWIAGGSTGYTFSWDPTFEDVTGSDLSIIMMNLDFGAANSVNVTFSIGVNIPIINAIGWILTIFGGLLTLLGVILVWSGFRSKPKGRVRTRYYQGAPAMRVEPIARSTPAYQLECSNCGALNEPDGSFCSQCGEILLSEDRKTLDSAVKKSKIDTFEPVSSQLIISDFGPRFWAIIIDFFIVGSITSIFSSLIFFSFGDWQLWSFGVFSPLQWLFSLGPTSLVFFIYSILMENYYGQTLGKMALSLEVVSEKTGERPDIQDLIISNLGRAFFLPLDLIIGRFARDDSQIPDLKQRLSQNWSNTVVIQKREEKKQSTQFVSGRF
ncbi:MAG: RDD family protein [Candidatus Hodarchaeales archaeon]|jgi:uncharacterized RDD family membrane protein YckC